MTTLYKESKTGTECPICVNHNTFFNYVNSNSGKPLFPELVGICKNEDCEHEMTPKQFNAQNFRDITLMDDLWRNAELQLKPKQYRKWCIEDGDEKDLRKTGLTKFLCTKFDENEVLQTLLKYCVCLCEIQPDEFLTQYWYLDNRKNAYNKKLVSYDPLTGRCTSSQEKQLPTPTLRTSKTDSGDKQDNNFSPNVCLFGLHLFDDTNTRQICLVESEKEAIIASIIFPDKIWMATGGQEISYSLIKPIIGQDVVLFPTNNKFYQWKEIAENYELGLSTMLKKNLNLPNTDFSDFILSKCDTWYE